MRVLKVRNVCQAYPQAARHLVVDGVLQGSRAGEVIRLPEPLTTVYERPLERVLFDPKRDCNPFFHVVEALWILAGRSDVASLTRFNARMADFSDNGETFHAPYGERLRHWKYMRHPDGKMDDQLDAAVALLRAVPGSRQVVVSVWDPVLDLGVASRDIPCNDMIKLEQGVDGRLNMYVFCRSNDMIWGAYGANVVQFSTLLEYVAARAGMEVGTYSQISINFHAYTAVWNDKRPDLAEPIDPYDAELVRPYPLIDTDPEKFDCDNKLFWKWLDGDTRGRRYVNGYFANVAEPMVEIYDTYKAGGLELALRMTDDIQATDWRLACRFWIKNRLAKRAQRA